MERNTAFSFQPSNSPFGHWAERSSLTFPEGTFAGFEKLCASMKRAAEHFTEIHSAFPPNLQQLSAKELMNACEISQDEGIPFFAVPGTRLTLELLALRNRSSRVSHLLRERERVLESCLDALQVTEGEITDCSTEAIEVLRRGHLRASQALSSAIVESLVIDLVGQGETSKSELAKERDIGSIRYAEIVMAIATMPLVQAYTSYRPQNDDPLPDGYSRHATIHRIDSPGVVSEETALIALMTACSMCNSLWDITA